MKRYRWLKAQWPISMRVLAKRLKTRPFEDGQTEGFVLDRVRDGFLDARFVEKMEYYDTIVDPFGTESSFHRIEYRKCEFKASVEGPGLELIDAPRSVQAMVSRLAEATEFSLAIRALSIDVLTWASNVQSHLKASGEVNSLQIGTLELSKDVQAKVVLKGTSDVLAAADGLVNGKKHIVEKVQLRFDGQRQTTVLLTNVGQARFEQEPTDEILAAVRLSLPF